jgi:8-oxo-dGTP pyrophosphatase MutT (NUDIX family)
LAQLRRLRECSQVAAICYRVGKKGIEFLLVQTRSGARWTFPKGSAEPGLTHAQAAALEAYEEAGVHGRMEEASFTSYSHEKRGARGRSADKTYTVSAHLCEVVRLDAPQESNRNRTWFCCEEAKEKLREGRSSSERKSLERVLRRAVRRIHQQRSRTSPVIDDMQKVTFIDAARFTVSGTRPLLAGTIRT